MSDRSKRRLGISIGAVLLLAVLIAGLLVMLSGGSATAKQIATLHIFEGQVEVERAGTTAAGTDGQALHEGDTVRTGSDGRAQIEYFDGSLTRLDFGTSFVLETLEASDDGGGSKVIEASQTAGSTYNRVTELTDSESRFDIDTPTATASVQGTVYAILVGPDGSTTIAVIEGMVVASSTAGAIDVPAGKMVVVGADGVLGALQDIPPDFLDSEWILFNQCDLDKIRDCVLGEVVTPEEPQVEPEEADEGSTPPPTGPIAPTAPGPSDDGPEPQNHAPSAGMVASELMGPAPHTVSFVDASSDQDGDALSRSWSFGDSSSHSGGTHVLHTYTEPGDYLATLTVTDPDGESDSVSALVQVTDGEAPVLTITGGPDDPSDSSDASFSFTSSEAGGGFFCSLDGAAASPCGGASARLGDLLRAFGGPLAPVSGSASYSGLADGPHSFSVSLTDAAGNTGSASWSWTIDTAPELDHIVISPSSSTIVLGDSQSYSATAFDTEGVSMGNVTASTTFSGANCTGNACSPTSVGAHTVTGTYQGESDTATLNVVAPAPPDAVFDHIVISPGSATITYGDSQAYTATAFDSDGASMGDVTANTTFTGANCSANVCTPTSAGPKTVTGSYSGSLGAGSDDALLTVNKKTLDVVVDPKSKTYGAADPAFTFSYSGFVLGDDTSDLDTPPTCGVSAAHEHVGSYLITCSGGADDNYAFSYGNAGLTVTKATLTVTADAKSKTYGAADPVFTFTYSGFVNGDTASVIDTAPTCSVAGPHSDVGVYTIACAGGADGDYAFSYVSASLTVGTKATLTVTADAKSKTYGAADPPFTFSYSGFVNGDTAAGIDTPPTCGVAAPHMNAGTYAIACSGGSDNNYDFSYVGANLTVNPAPLTVAPQDVTITEGDPEPPFQFTYSGFVNGDTAAVIDTAPTCGVAGPHSVAGTYTIACSGGVDGDYAFSYGTATLTVEEAPPECPTHTLAFHVQPPSVTEVGDKFIVQVRASLIGGGSAGGITITLSLSPGAFSGGETVETTGNGNGLAVFNNLEVGEPGEYVLTASAACADAIQVSFTVTEASTGAATIGGTISSDTAAPDARERESGFRSLGLVIVLPLLALRRRRRH